MQTSAGLFHLVITAIFAWGFVAYATYRMTKDGFGLFEFSIALFTPLLTTLIIAIFQEGDLSIKSLFPLKMLSYGGDSHVYLAQSKMIIECKPELIQYLPGFAVFIAPLVLLEKLFCGGDTSINIAILTVNYLLIFPLIFLLIYKSALHASKKESNTSRISIYAIIFILAIFIYINTPPGYMIEKNVFTASHRILGLVVVYEPYYYFCSALTLYMATKINNYDDYFILGLLIGFSITVTERSILWLSPLVFYQLLIITRNKLQLKKVLLLIFAGIALIIFCYIFYNFLYYNTLLHDSRGAYWMSRCLHWGSRMNSLYPGLDSQCPPRLSIEYIPYNFKRLTSDYWFGLAFVFTLIALLIPKNTRLLAISLIFIALLNILVNLSYINPQTFLKYTSILVWLFIFSLATLVFKFKIIEKQH